MSAKYSSLNSLSVQGASLLAQMVKNLPPMQETQETWVQSLGQEEPLEKGTAIHSSISAWRIPWTEEPGGLQSMESQRVGHDWATNTYIALSSKNDVPQKQLVSSSWNPNNSLMLFLQPLYPDLRHFRCTFHFATQNVQHVYSRVKTFNSGDLTKSIFTASSKTLSKMCIFKWLIHAMKMTVVVLLPPFGAKALIQAKKSADWPITAFLLLVQMSTEWKRQIVS